MRSTAVTSPASHPVCSREARHLRLEALAPEPHLVGRQAEAADDVAAGVHDRLQLRRRGAGGPHRRLVGEVVGRRAVGLGPLGGRHQDVAVLHAGVELDLGPGARPSSASSARDAPRPPPRWTGGRRRSRPSCRRRRRSTGCSGRRRGRAAAAARGRRPRSAPGRCGSGPGRSRGSTCCRRRCPAAARAGSPRPGRPRRAPRAGRAWASTRPRAACCPSRAATGGRRTRPARTRRTSWRAVWQGRPVVPNPDRRAPEQAERGCDPPGGTAEAISGRSARDWSASDPAGSWAGLKATVPLARSEAGHAVGAGVGQRLGQVGEAVAPHSGAISTVDEHAAGLALPRRASADRSRPGCPAMIV